METLLYSLPQNRLWVACWVVLTGLSIKWIVVFTLIVINRALRPSPWKTFQCVCYGGWQITLGLTYSVSKFHLELFQGPLERDWSVCKGHIGISRLKESPGRFYVRTLRGFFSEIPSFVRRYGTSKRANVLASINGLPLNPTKPRLADHQNQPSNLQGLYRRCVFQTFWQPPANPPSIKRRVVQCKRVSVWVWVWTKSWLVGWLGSSFSGLYQPLKSNFTKRILKSSASGLLCTRNLILEEE